MVKGNRWCVCVCTCVCVRACACVFVCVRVSERERERERKRVHAKVSDVIILLEQNPAPYTNPPLQRRTTRSA